MRHERGFTLIELLIVVAIIAILATILVPNFLRARAQSQVAASESNLKNLGTALESYFIDMGQYPIGTGTTVLNALIPTYLQALPVDPCTSLRYRYTSTSGTTYRLSINFPLGNQCNAIVGTAFDSWDLRYTPDGGLQTATP